MTAISSSTTLAVSQRARKVSIFKAAWRAGDGGGQRPAAVVDVIRWRRDARQAPVAGHADDTAMHARIARTCHFVVRC
jgi:hypothetical protein